MKYYVTIIFLTLLSLTNVEERHQKLSDSLSSKDFSFFEDKIIEIYKDTAGALDISKAWLKKAYAEKNIEQQANAYKAMMHFVDKEFRMIYADSLIEKAKATNNSEILGSAYLTVGAAYYDNKEYTNALDFYILANKYVSKTNDRYLQNKVKYTIALTKYFLGYYEESIALLTQCISYFKNENELAYIKSIHAIALCYSQINRYDLSSFHSVLGLKLANDLEMPGMIPYFKNAEGINYSKQNEFKSAIKLLNESLPELEKNKDYANQITTWFYLGKCYWGIKEKNKAMEYYLKVHEGIETNKYSRPDLREIYESLIDFYAENKDHQKQLLYVEKLLDFDKVINKEFKYLSYKIHKDYDTNTLLTIKNEIESELNKKNKQYKYVLSSLSAILVALGGWHLYSKKREKRKFNQIMLALAEKTNSTTNQINNHNTNLSQELTSVLIQNLEKFEREKLYLQKDMGLNKLASALNTNTKYAIILIANHRGKKTTTYINDLKIDHIVELLLNSSRYRNYTNKALSEEAGFGSTQIFTLCFKTKIGMSPTSFIHQLKMANENNSKKKKEA